MEINHEPSPAMDPTLSQLHADRPRINGQTLAEYLQSEASTGKTREQIAAEYRAETSPAARVERASGGRISRQKIAS